VKCRFHRHAIPRREKLRRKGSSSFLLLVLALTLNAGADGIYGNGIGARSMAMGGADVAWASDPLGAMGVNPAGLGFLNAPELNLGAFGGFVSGSFNKPGVSNGDLSNSWGVLPEGAFGSQVGKSPVFVGISFVPEANLLADWHYNDPPGGLGGATSYGYQEDKSEILALRSALGIAVKINPELSIGASVGAVYNENRLITPYTFQNLSPGPNGPNNSGLDGAKTLLNLHTSGYGWNALVGVMYRPMPDLQLGVSYESETQINSTGSASGDPSIQLGLPMGTVPFLYDASVKTIFPQQVKAGISWKFQPQWRLALQMDWIDYKDAFHSLPLTFSNGNNPALNAALGSGFGESTPLSWQSEFVYRTGIEFEVTPNLVLRAGYCYGSSPVPDSTLTPMTAAIMEHTFTAGMGYHWDRYSVDFSYQYDLPATQNIGTSGLLSGDYSNSSIKVQAQTFALTTSMKF
jgi:long-chain fatty acid transport protein